MKTVLFDLDGTLLPMDQEVFIKAYLGGLAKKLAPYGYDPKALVDGIWAGTGAMVKNDGAATNDEVFWNRFSRLLGADVRKDEPIFNAFYENEFQQVSKVCGFDPQAAQVIHFLKERGAGWCWPPIPFFLPSLLTAGSAGRD